MPPVRVALIGAGIFAKRTHLPALLASQSLFTLVALYSRSQRSVEALRDGLPASHPAVTLYFESADNDLVALLARKDIDAVIIALPVGAQEAVAKRALESGKHVLSEKPIAGTGDAAKALLAWYAALPSVGSPPPPRWAVAENWRAEPAVLYAAQLVRAGGAVRTFSLQCFLETAPDNAYVGTGWRVGPGSLIPSGGFVVDGGVHWIAMLRALVGDVRRAVAFSSLCAPHCAPIDSVAGALALARPDGRSGTVNICFSANGRPFDILLTVVCDGGTVAIRVGPGASGKRTFAVTWTPEGGGDGGSSREFGFGGIEAEFAEFARMVRGELRAEGDADRPDLSPEQALCDLLVVEALLKSGEQGGAPVDV